MKNSNDQPPKAVEQQQCNEEKCATCFENRGCMYEQLGAALRKMEERLEQNDVDVTNKQISRRA